MIRRLEGVAALVTGGSRSIGAGIAKGLAEHGARVVVNFHSNEAAAAEVVGEIVEQGGHALALQADVSDPDDVSRLITGTVEAFGSLDLLVNNAGTLTRHDVLTLPVADWDRVMATNLTGTFLCSQAAGRIMTDKRSGSIVNVCSINATRARVGLAHYSASKAGVWMLTRQLALEYAPFGVRVNSVSLGLIETDMNRDRLADPQVREELSSPIPLGIVGEPRDVVGAVTFLGSDEARLVTGADLVVDGGRSLT